MRYAPLALLALSACGAGGGGSSVAESAYIVVSVTLPLDHPHAAYTTWVEGEPTRIEIRPDQPGLESLRSLLIHELEHAVGVPGHSADKSCYRQTNSGAMTPGEPPCGEEVALMLERAGAYEVEVRGDSALVNDVAFACSFWEFWTEGAVEFVFVE